jgi:aspartyl-tRNA synthetase
MVGGFDKYFQIAPCFRDEDPRSDRLYGDFYQLDFEMSFSTQEDVFEVGQKVFYDVFSEFGCKEVSSLPFRRIPYLEAMEKYGSDKPDLRIPFEIENITSMLNGNESVVFKDKEVKVMKVLSSDKSNSWFKKLEEEYKELGVSSLGFIKSNIRITSAPVENQIASMSEVSNSITSVITNIAPQIQGINSKTNSIISTPFALL